MRVLQHGLVESADSFMPRKKSEETSKPFALHSTFHLSNFLCSSYIPSYMQDPFCIVGGLLLSKFLKTLIYIYIWMDGFQVCFRTFEAVMKVTFVQKPSVEQHTHRSRARKLRFYGLGVQ